MSVGAEGRVVELSPLGEVHSLLVVVRGSCKQQ